MLVKESETNKEELMEAIRNKNRMRIKEIIHRMFPMWETLKITASLDRLVSAAENEINSLIRQENEKENTDS